MGNQNKAKGTRFETLTVEYLRSRGFRSVYRPAIKGSYDTGDINGITNHPKKKRQAIIQCKNAKTFKLSEWLDKTQEQADQAEVKSPEDVSAVPILLVKRPRMGASQMGKQYAILEFEDLLDLLIEAGYS